MRVELIARGGKALSHGVGNLCVGVARSGDVGTNGIDAVVIESEDAREVAWRTHVHGVGERRNGRTRVVVASQKILVENVIGVVGSDETIDRQSHALAEETGSDVAKIA